MKKKARKWKKEKDRVSAGLGGLCPKCTTPMNRFRHGPKWRPLPNQPCWYEYWDMCPNGHHLQHYDAARQFAAWCSPEGMAKVIALAKSKKRRAKTVAAAPDDDFEHVDPLTQEWRAIVG